MAIGYVWGIPLHHGCRCEQKKIKPGAQAPNAFVDFREVLDGLDHTRQVAAIGASNYRLLKEGIVDWKDIVTPSRVRDLREVVSLKKISIQTMVGVGVDPKIAERAHATVNTAEHILLEHRRRELVANLKGAGLANEQLSKELGSRLANRVTIAAGPDNYGTGPAWPGGGPKWGRAADRRAWRRWQHCSEAGSPRSRHRRRHRQVRRRLRNR